MGHRPGSRWRSLPTSPLHPSAASRVRHDRRRGRYIGSRATLSQPVHMYNIRAVIGRSYFRFFIASCASTNYNRTAAGAAYDSVHLRVVRFTHEVVGGYTCVNKRRARPCARRSDAIKRSVRFVSFRFGFFFYFITLS